MAYDSNKAVPGDKPNTDQGPADKPSLGAMQSNQERATGDGVRTVAITTADSEGTGYTTTHRKYGTLVRVQPNNRNTGTLKDPLNCYTSKVLPAVSNPSDKQYDKYAVPAAGKNNGKPSL